MCPVLLEGDDMFMLVQGPGQAGAAGCRLDVYVTELRTDLSYSTQCLTRPEKYIAISKVTS